MTGRAVRNEETARPVRLRLWHECDRSRGPGCIASASRVFVAYRGRVSLAATVVLCALAAVVGVTPAIAGGDSNQTSCPSSTESSPGFRPYLPDCRAYEQVTDLDKGGSNVVYGFAASPVTDPRPSNVYFASSDGLDVMFGLTGGPEAEAGQIAETYAATRTASGWTDSELSPPLALEHPSAFNLYGAAIFSDVIGGDFAQPLFQIVGAAASDPSRASLDVYERNHDGSLSLISRGSLAPGGTDTSEAAYAGSSPDGSHILFLSAAILEPQAAGLSTGAIELYDRSAGQTHVVGLLPGDSLEPAGVVLGDGSGYVGGSGGLTQGTQAWSADHAISSDGSRVFFQNVSGLIEVYVREDNSSTTEVSLSQRTGSVGTPAPSGALFQWASPDGSKVFFTSRSELTDKATAEGGLYEYDLRDHTLSFLTPDAADPSGASVPLDAVIAASEDGSRIYFIAEGKLEGSGLAGAGTAGQPNLYLYEPRIAGGAINSEPLRFVATLSPSDQITGNSGLEPQVRATPDGRYVVFRSFATPTGYQNNGHAEIYRYDAEATSEPLICISCDPTSLPVADASLNRLTFGAPTFLTVFSSDFSPIRNLSKDGSMVFFETAEPLVPQAVNGKVNVYEWHNGQLALISDGTGPEDAHLYDVSASGADVFFTTYDQLVPSDGDGALDVYDARSGGGFPPAPPPVAGCSSEGECRSALSTPPVFGTPSSATFAGSGNLTPRASSIGAKPLTRAQKLARALKACKRQPRKRRALCLKNAKRRFAAKSQATTRHGRSK
jgi:hypothetical protein